MASDYAPSSIQKVRVKRSDSAEITSDSVVVEEPLEIRIKKGEFEQQLGITMRTPGADIELAAGFLWSEGLLRERDDLIAKAKKVLAFSSGASAGASGATSGATAEKQAQREYAERSWGTLGEPLDFAGADAELRQIR